MLCVALQTEEYVNGQLKNKYGDAFIRGNNVNPPLARLPFALLATPLTKVIMLNHEPMSADPVRNVDFIGPPPPYRCTVDAKCGWLGALHQHSLDKEAVICLLPSEPTAANAQAA